MENKNPFFSERIQMELENWVEYRKNQPKELLVGNSYVYHQIWIIFIFDWWKVGGLVTKLCLTVYNPMDCNPPGSFVHKIDGVQLCI